MAFFAKKAQYVSYLSLDVTKSQSESLSTTRRDNRLVREDSQTVKLDSFLKLEPSVTLSPPRLILSSKRSAKRKADLDLTTGGVHKRQKLTLDSMVELRNERILAVATELRNLLKNFTVVGPISPSRWCVQECF